MATKLVKQRDHAQELAAIRGQAAAPVWGERLMALELIAALLADLPTENTVEQLLQVLAKLAGDGKWEVRKATLAVLVQISHPAVRQLVEQLAGDPQQWVRQAAERAKRKLAQITTSAEKKDRRVQFAFELIQNLKTTAPEKLYEAALLIGEKYYEELAGDTAHELNTFRAALDGLMGELEYALAQDDRVAAMTMVARMRLRCQYLKGLVNGLLEYARDSAGDFQRQQVRPLVEEALVLARGKSQERVGQQSVQETVVIADDLEVEACRPRLVQALTNILSNAFEALTEETAAAQAVTIVAMDSLDRLVLQIKDSGGGMDPTQVESAKKRFRSLKKDRGGIGLGLPLALKIIEREHNGRLELESELGGGTTVTVEIPLRHEVKQGHGLSGSGR